MQTASCARAACPGGMRTPCEVLDVLGEIDCPEYARWRKSSVMLGTIDLSLGLVALASTAVLVVRVILAANTMDATITAMAHKNVLYSEEIVRKDEIIADREGRITVQAQLLHLAGEKLTSAIAGMAQPEPSVETAHAP